MAVLLINRQGGDSRDQEHFAWYLKLDNLFFVSAFYDAPGQETEYFKSHSKTMKGQEEHRFVTRDLQFAKETVGTETAVWTGMERVLRVTSDWIVKTGSHVRYLHSFMRSFRRHILD